MSRVPSLAVTLGRLSLANPILTASGTSGYGQDLEHQIDLTRLGGFVCKSLSLRPREGNPPQRLVETPSGMLNSIGLQNIGVQRFIDERLPRLRGRGFAVIANIFGETVEEFAAIADLLERAGGIDAIELNISCPNTARGGIEFGVDPEATARVTAAVRAVTKHPVVVKLSPNVTDITTIARAAVDAGADILSLVNTFMGMAIDTGTGRPVLSSGSGGLSGPAIRPMAVHLVHRVAGAVDVPLIGIGGIRTAQDVLEFMMAGASAVEIGTATFREPGATIRILDDLLAHCRDHAITDINGIIGVARRTGRGTPAAG